MSILSLIKKYRLYLMVIGIFFAGYIIFSALNQPKLPKEKATTLRLTSPLSEVYVIIDGTGGELDPTPKQLLPLALRVAPGQHRIEAGKQGYQTKVYSVNLPVGETRLEITLKPERGFNLLKLPTENNLQSYNWFDDSSVVYFTGDPWNVMRKVDFENTKTLFILPEKSKVFWANQGAALVQNGNGFSLYTVPNQLFRFPYNSSYVSLSPFGKQIAYLKDDRLFVEDFALVPIKSDGYQLPLNEALGEVVWSPKKSLLLLAFSNQNLKNLYLLDLKKDKITLISSNISWPKFSPDGEKISYLETKNLVIKDSDNKVIKKVTLENEVSLVNYEWLTDQEIILIEKSSNPLNEGVDDFWLVYLEDEEKTFLGVSAPILGRVNLSLPIKVSLSGNKILFGENNGSLWVLDLLPTGGFGPR